MTKVMLAALAMCCTTAMGACPESKGKADVQEVQIQRVSNETPAKGDCPLACDGAKGAVQQVSNEPKGDCSKSCDGTDAAVQTVASETKGDCSKSCDGTGAAVQTVASETKSECTKTCDEAKAAVQTVAYSGDEKSCSGDKAACAEGAIACTGDSDCNEPCKLTCAAPKLLMKVGNETTACSETASKMCEKTGATMSYVVNDAEYDCPDKARAAHEAAMVAYLDSLTHVSFNVGGEHMECPMSAASACKSSDEGMRYQVGPMLFDNAEDAVRAAAMARGMMQQVAMSYEVDGKSTKCSTEACEMASVCETKHVMYVVNDKKTECEKTAHYNLTEAQLMAAIEGVRMAVSQG